MGKRKKNMEAKEDRISDLPDSIIHHILSFLPSTKQAVQTGILSKRWRNQWTHVPVLIFESTWTGMTSYDCFLDFIRDTLKLHDCSKIKKFHLYYPPSEFVDPWFDEKICFAARKNVEDLYLTLISVASYVLPKDIFNNASLVKLRTDNCRIMPNGKVNWRNLTTLTLVACKFTDQAIEHILSGSPALESFELTSSSIEYKKIVISSKSMKRLVLGGIDNASDIEISCPNLAKLRLFVSWEFETSKLLNLPSSLRAAIYVFELKILQQLQHVKELKIGRWFIKSLSDLEPMEGLVLPVLNIKCLTLKYPDLNKHHFGVACLLLNTPVIEKLVIQVPPYDQISDLLPELNDVEDNYWISSVTVFDCLVSHIKTIQIIGLPKGDDMRKLVLNFVQFLLKNARVLEKMVIVMKDNGTTFPSDVSQELLSLSRCSQKAIIEFLCLE